MTRPPRGLLNPTTTDDTTDAWDTVDWLSKHVPESNGRVGMIGSSYEGWTVVMALLDPHPMLKVAAPESPMVDGWMGDDWFHYGAFRDPNLDYITGQTTARGEGKGIERETYDDFTGFIRAGSVGSYAQAHGVQGYPFLQRMEQHPAYDGFWQGQALDHLIAEKPCKVPTMWEQGPVGPGGHVGRQPQLGGAEGQGLPGQQLPGHRPMAPQRGQLRRLKARGAGVQGRHGHRVAAPTCCCPSSTSTCAPARPRPIHRRCSSTTAARTTGTD